MVAGDQVYRKGALRGGHHDQRNSRLKLMNAFRAATLSRQQLQEKLNGVRTKIQDILSTSTSHADCRLTDSEYFILFTSTEVAESSMRCSGRILAAAMHVNA